MSMIIAESVLIGLLSMIAISDIGKLFKMMAHKQYTGLGTIYPWMYGVLIPSIFLCERL